MEFEDSLIVLLQIVVNFKSFFPGLWYLAEQDEESPCDTLNIEETYGIKPQHTNSS